MMKKALIIQGGGFRTAFSTGVLDAFQKNQYNPFDLFIGVSGGAIAMIYYIAQQPLFCFESIKYLAANKKYLDFARIFNSQAIVDVDIFYEISNTHMPLDFKIAENNLYGKQLAIVMTNRKTGTPHYHSPSATDWQEAIIASCSFPFLTKGKHILNDTEYMDGAWSDPIPVKWAAKQGANDITIIRTQPSTTKLNKSWLDLFGEFYYRNDKGLKTAFAKNHLNYNQAVDFIKAPPKNICIKQIAPTANLKAGIYTNSRELLIEDYNSGYSMGEQFIKQTILQKPDTNLRL